MKNKKKNLFAGLPLGYLLVIIGVLLFSIVFIVSANMDLKEFHAQLTDTVNYVQEQCASYITLNKSSEAKSQLRIMESIQQVRRELVHTSENGRKIPDNTMLQEYVVDEYLTGVLLLDRKGNTVSEYFTDELGSAGLKEYLQKEAVLDVAEYPEKTYAIRIECEDGSNIDLATAGRLDEDGVVAVYYHTKADYTQKYTLLPQKLMDGLGVEKNGTIVITKGDQIVASNEGSMIGSSTDDITVLKNIRESGRTDQVVRVKSSSHGFRYSYGMIDRGRDYYVYVYVPARKVFTTTLQSLLMTAVIYAMIVFLIQMVRWKSEQGYHEVQLKQEQLYQGKLLEAAKKAERANNAKTEFLQRMSHDIRTPINGIRGMVEIGDYYRYDMDKQAECRQKIWESSGLLLELVNEVLDMGKLESGEIVLEERTFQMESLIAEICVMQEQAAAERGIKITCEKELPHKYLIGSPVHVKRLIMNILSNAVKYNRDNGEIFLKFREIREEGEKVWIEFICKDTGIGMSPEFQKHIFEPFTQETSDARSSYTGTGLGMAITKSLIDKMGGTITLQSEKNVGTVYHITLPLRKAEEPSEEAVTIEKTEKSLEGIHVLLAEDNELNMEIAEFILESAGAEVLKACDGKQAVDLFKKSKPGEIDAILMDIMMPVMDGHQATRKIRSMERQDAKSIPIIAMTANAFDDDRKKAYEAGMNEHMTKPLEAEKVIRTVLEYVHR